MPRSEPRPPAGTLEIAASPLGTSANFKPADGDKKPGNFPVSSGVMYPDGCKHRNSAMLDFCGTTALEVLNAAITGEPCWIPKTPLEPAHRVHSRRHEEERQCSWPSRPKRCQSIHPVQP